MRLALGAAFLLLAACGGPAKPKVILPGTLDLTVAKEDEVRPSCPSELPGQEKDNTIDCLYGAAVNALAPYEAQLKEKGWSSLDGGSSWTGPPTADGEPGACLTVRSFQSNFRRRERTVLEFELVATHGGCHATA